MGLTHRRARSTRQRRRRKPEQEPPDPQFSCSSVWPKFEARSLKGHLPRSVARPPERYTCATFCVPMLVSASFCYNLRQFAAWSSQHPSVMVHCRRLDRKSSCRSIHPIWQAKHTRTAVTTAKLHALARTVERSTRVFKTHAVSRSSPGCQRDIAGLGLDDLFADERWSTQVDHARTDEQSIRSRAE